MGRYDYGRGYGYGYGFFAPQMTKAEKTEKALHTIARLKKSGRDLSPVPEISGRIAKTFWGKAWCDNIESYRDYAYRLERGRSYVRAGTVIDLRIEKGRIHALVVGSGRNPYNVSITIDPMAKPKWDALVKRATGKIASLMALVQGELPKELIADFCNRETGLFPKPDEIHFDCSCPDGAACCKHIAAVLYGIGARLDTDPSLFFTLRGIDPDAIVASEVVETLTEGTEAEIDTADLGGVFGISLDTEPPPETGRKTSGKKPSTSSSGKKATTPRAVPKKAGRKPSGRGTMSKKTTGKKAAEDDGKLLLRTRQRLGLSQTEMGRRLGTYQMKISMIERGKLPLPNDWRKALLSM